jgi:hypothetical protein
VPLGRSRSPGQPLAHGRCPGRSPPASKPGKLAGKELIVEETQDGVLLRAVQPFSPTKPKEVFGALSHHGKRLSDEDIEKLRATSKRRNARY